MIKERPRMPGSKIVHEGPARGKNQTGIRLTSGGKEVFVPMSPAEIIRNLPLVGESTTDRTERLRKENLGILAEVLAGVDEGLREQGSSLNEIMSRDK